MVFIADFEHVIACWKHHISTVKQWYEHLKPFMIFLEIHEWLVDISVNGFKGTVII